MASREERDTAQANHQQHVEPADPRGGEDAEAGTSDAAAARRDQTRQVRDALRAVPDARIQDVLTTEFEKLRTTAAEAQQGAAEERERAAEEREHARQERTNAARERARLEAELQTAHIDGPTGALRREPGRLAVANEIERARRIGEPFLVAFLDVDRLKEVNDRDGHAAGDRVLAIVVQVLRTRLRPYDVVFRYGGDEFVCGLAGIDGAEVSNRFSDIAAAIEAKAGITVSVGTSSLADGDTADELIARADEAMLAVKARHRSEAESPRGA
jgi:diguanylate cyclase (GGDEF)-like protein